MAFSFVLSTLVWARLKLFAIPEEINVWSILAWSAENTLAICGVTVLTTFFSNEFGKGTSRAFVLCMFPVTFSTLILTRCLALFVVWLLQQRTNSPRIALIGDWSAAKRLILRMESHIKESIRGVILPEGATFPRQSEMLPVLGTTTQLAEVVNRERLERVIVINGSLPESELARCNSLFWKMGLPVSSTLSFAVEPEGISSLWPKFGRIELANLNGLRIVDMQPAHFQRVYGIAKSILDIAGTILLLVVTFPVIVVTAVLVKLTSPGPIFEKAPRVGLGGRHFSCLKFRTTYEDLNLPAPARDWSSPSEQHHPTRLGKILRRYSLDELPQLINILRGEMSLVGPRPLPAHSLGPDGMNRAFGAWSEARSSVYPGLTGLWQVAGRCSLPFDEMINLDLEYVHNQSLWLDAKILVKTPLAVIRAIGA